MSEEFNFERRIIQRVTTEELTLECGHTSVCVVPVPWPNDTLYCSQCLHDWLEKNRDERRR